MVFSDTFSKDFTQNIGLRNIWVFCSTTFLLYYVFSNAFHFHCLFSKGTLRFRYCLCSNWTSHGNINRVAKKLWFSNKTVWTFGWSFFNVFRIFKREVALNPKDSRNVSSKLYNVVLDLFIRSCNFFHLYSFWCFDKNSYPLVN